MSGEAIAAEKAALRKLMRARRAALPPETRAAASVQACERVLASFPELKQAPDATIAGYWPIRDELDPRPLLQALAGDGYRLALPMSVARDEPLVFRAWKPGDPLVPDIMRIEAPLPTAPEVVPWLLLVPMLAFDRKCCRLGYGAGFYDRTLAALGAGGATVTVGLAFSVQEVERVPVTEDDAPLDAIVTESRLIIG
ncbi:MAG TPA: 5-formyltetrahydrofolate cyclo-ligase [Stellaceae bacterium]|nr:5-formyltetrahydrofolate cyclo-ligase [Stellaceae bacterium]